MRSFQSFTALEIESCTGTLTHSSPEPCDTELNPQEAVLSFSNPAGLAQSQGLLHDARNLVAAIRIYCDLLGEPGVLKPEHANWAEELRRLSVSSHHLMERWIQLQRPEADPEDQIDSSHMAVPLGDVMERLSGLLHQVSGRREITWNFGPAARLPVTLSEEAMERILVNLVRNSAAALDQAEWSGTLVDKAASPLQITVGYAHSAHSQDMVSICVEDAGCGMDAIQLAELTGAVQREKGRRRGMGFSIVRELVGRAGGSVHVNSELGVGTCIRIDVPVTDIVVTSGEGRCLSIDVPVPEALSFGFYAWDGGTSAC